MTNKDIIDLGGKYLFQIYPRAPLALVRGKGCRVWDADGKEYLDFFASTVVVNLGHCHPNVTRAITEQATTILHVSNLHHSAPQAELAQRLVTTSFADRAFFCNSGAEANEAAIKLRRRSWRRPLRDHHRRRLLSRAHHRHHHRHRPGEGAARLSAAARGLPLRGLR
jgi:acetylornithine/N-succinyldiaminopimelate aminotransferase